MKILLLTNKMTILEIVLITLSITIIVSIICAWYDVYHGYYAKFMQPKGI